MSSSARKINIGVWMYEYDIIIVESIVLISNSFRGEYRHTDTGYGDYVVHAGYKFNGDIITKRKQYFYYSDEI